MRVSLTKGQLPRHSHFVPQFEKGNFCWKNGRCDPYITTNFKNVETS